MSDYNVIQTSYKILDITQECGRMKRVEQLNLITNQWNARHCMQECKQGFRVADYRPPNINMIANTTSVRGVIADIELIAIPPTDEN